MKLLYYADSEPGGIFDYSVLQSIALHKLCGNVTVLGLPEYGKRLHSACPELRFVELHDSPRSSNKWVRGFQAIQRRRKQTSQLAELVRRGAFSHVLMSNYAEYYAPFWFKPLARSAKCGVRFGVVIHDPVRDFVVGPKFWHEWCVKLACSFCQDIFVHHAASATDCYWPKESKITEIAFGPYNIHKPTAIPSREESRLKLSLDPNAVVFLSFGHIRDGKNLDLVIRALVDVQMATCWWSERSNLRVRSRCRSIGNWRPSAESQNAVIGSTDSLQTTKCRTSLLHLISRSSPIRALFARRALRWLSPPSIDCRLWQAAAVGLFKTTLNPFNLAFGLSRTTLNN